MRHQRWQEEFKKIQGHDKPKKPKPKPKPAPKPEEKVLSNPPGDVAVNRVMSAVRKAAK